MMFDKQNCFDWQRTFAGAAGNYLSTDAIDTYGGLSVVPEVPKAVGINGPVGGPIGRDFGRGEPHEVVVQTVAATFAGGTSIQVQFVQADDAALGTNLEVLAETAAITLAVHNVVGYRWRIQVVPVGITRRYIGVRYVSVGTYTGGVGALSAGLVRNRESSYTP